MKRIRIFVYGKVQGVFFRYHTRRKAQSLGIKGWVKNREDGSVEILADGMEETLKNFVRWCRLGPPDARVEKIEIIEEKIKEKINDFEIIY